MQTGEDLRKKGGIALVTQIARPKKIAMNLSLGDHLVPMVLVQSGGKLSGQLVFRGHIYYPSRIGGNGGLKFLERSVQEVLDLRCEPLVLMDSNDRMVVAVYYTPGPEAKPLTLVDIGLEAT